MPKLKHIQQYLKNGTIKDIQHVKSSEQLADVFTKYGVSDHQIIECVSNGNLHCLEGIQPIQKEDKKSDS